MTQFEVANFVRRAEQVYSSKWRHELEAKHADEFVAIEPDSGDCFLGKTLSEAIGAARRKYPDRLAHGMKVGHRAAIHFGMQVR